MSPVGSWIARPVAASGMATRPTAAAPRPRVAQRLQVEHADAADDERGAEHVQQVRDREQPGRMPADMPERRLLEEAQDVGVEREHGLQRSSKALPLTMMRSARISRSVRVDG